MWFREDLRLADNLALEAAAFKNTPIIPIYIREIPEEGERDLGRASQWWLHHSLVSLEMELAEAGLKLVIRQGCPLENLRVLIKESGAQALFWTRRYEPWAIKKDTHIKKVLSDEGVEVKSFKGQLLYEPWEITSEKGAPFKVFTPFWKKCQKLPVPSFSLQPSSLVAFPGDLDSWQVSDLELLPKIKWDEGITKSWRPGSIGAKAHLENFIQEGLVNYQKDRDIPSIVSGVSRLSPHLHFGEISPRQIWEAVKNHPEREPFLRQLGWREFAYHLLYHFPTTVHEPLRKEFSAFPWKTDAEKLERWQKGQTGYPFVDAGMRELWLTGWMHNRVRMVVGSFLVKDLMIAWQEGEKWFWDTLVDADLANNCLGWQWVAGCGADAAPFFRIFNPITQGLKFDPEGLYVRRFVPELKNLPDEWIHTPWLAPSEVLEKAGIVLGKSYPFPIVNHDEVRKAALHAYQEM